MSELRAADHARRRARLAWGPEPPDWVAALAEACDRAGSSKTVAKQIGYSQSVVSQVLSRGYRGNLSKVEAQVRAYLMHAQVHCRAFNHEISRRACLDWQSQPFPTSHRGKLQVWKACRSGCPHFDGETP